MIHTIRRAVLVLWVGAVFIGLIPVSDVHAAQYPPILPSSTIFDVRNGDQEGKLVLTDTELAFESLTDSKHSRRWNYADIRELTRKKKNLRVRPLHGETYDFQFKKKEERDRIYDLITAKILAAKQLTK